jgi:hypothetical protein
MHSLNQVNKLVSCGRDPARSLPLWRGFLLIPLILVCFAFASQTRAAVDVVPPPDGCYPGFTTAEGCQALKNLADGTANTALGWRALYSAGDASFNVGVGAGALVLTRTNGDANTGVGTAAILLNQFGMRNTGVGAAVLLNTDGPAQQNGEGSFNGGVGAFALNANTSGFSNNAMGDSALFRNQSGAQNTAIGDEALENNDATNTGSSFNTAVGALALFNNVTGVGNTGVGQGVGPNIANGFNNTYVGSLVGTNADDEDLTIRIGDVSADGFGSAACYIGGIFNNEQPLAENVVVVTLNLDTDELGWDGGVARSGNAPAAPNRNAPQPRVRPQPGNHAMLNQKVEQLQATVTEQQRQIETLTTQLKEQAAQIQKVSAQLEMVRPTPRVVENR